MALIRVCDRCESDSSRVVVLVHFTINKRGKQSKNQSSDLCPKCIKQLRSFLSGEYCDEDWEEDEDPKSKTEQDDSYSLCSDCDKPRINCDCATR